ncbi:IS110 family transposase [Methylomonas sp. AM2-LC]|uniref:IS110 family transposase n=1 Tax=Methylomonas sp. AM2-LC TaxID=3153301 RepID=UPI003265AD4B
MIKNNVIGLDLAKNIFHLVSFNAELKQIKKKVKRADLLSYIANLPVSIIGMEACGGSHYWAREIKKLGHEVVLLNARYVKGFVVGNKNDYNDAEAIWTATHQPKRRTVSLKTLEQQDIQMLHRLRQSTVDERTAVANRIRGFLGEWGIVLPIGINQLRTHLTEIIEDAENGLSVISRNLFAKQLEKLKELDKTIKEYDKQIDQLCIQSELCQRFVEVPGIGAITATMAASDIGDGKGYTKSKNYAASLGIVPKQHTSGDKVVLLGISKRGNGYLRTLLIHGARSVLKNCQGKTDSLSRWLQALIERRGFNKAAVALANKNARILWVMATQNKRYEVRSADVVMS